MSLTTVQEVKTMLGVANSARDAQYTALLPAAERIIKNIARNEFVQATYTEYYTGNLTNFIILRRIPVVSVANVWLDPNGVYGDPVDAFPASTLLTAGADYTLRRDASDAGGSNYGVLIRLHGLWPQFNRVSMFGFLNAEAGPEWGNIKVEYTAGYNPIPADVKLCVAQMMEWLRTHNIGVAIESEKIGDYMVKYVNQNSLRYPELGSIRSTLANYRDIVV